jgi:uncharacterized protein
MIIKIAGLNEGIHDYEFRESVKNLELGRPFIGDLTAEVRLSKSHSEIILDVDVKVKSEFECDRCTKTFIHELNPVYRIVYIFGNEPENIGDANLVYIHPDKDKINIAPEIRDYSLLTVPMKRLCSEDCKGLCPGCGKDLNEGDCECEAVAADSRWLPLLELKKKLNNN